jgi:antagonist of KipI
MAALYIQSAGLFTTIQDAGRMGYQRFGMPVSGAMDLFSLQLANRLVGNPPHAAAIEATLNGPEIQFSDYCALAICGADMQPCINHQPVPLNMTIGVKNGDRLTFAGLKTGCRAYIAFSGGIDVPVVMGSRSTFARAAIGGMEGRALRAGDVLQLGERRGELIKKNLPASLIPGYRSVQSIRIIPGPESKRLDFEGMRRFLSLPYKVTQYSDRMGMRLSGEPITCSNGAYDIISAGISMGTIQLPGNGEPIILMADRQTTGGYARIACVINVDLTLVAQLKPDDQIFFCQISLLQAQEIYRERMKIINRI